MTVRYGFGVEIVAGDWGECGRVTGYRTKGQ